MPEHHDDYLWNPNASPDPEIVRLENSLRVYRTLSVAKADHRPGGTSIQAPRFRARRVRWPLAAAAAFVLLFGALNFYGRVSRPWSVLRLPHDRSLSLNHVRSDRVSSGATITTDSVSRARLNVGSIGRAELGPSSQVRVLRTGLTEHRLALIAGSLHARIWAPPRFFIVETTGVEAIDLGCVYTLRADSSGGVLQVESGEVELAGKKHRVRVPAGNIARVHPVSGPGLPYPTGTPASFVSLVRQYEQEPNSDRANVLLAAATQKETITLWHLIPRETGQSRDLVYARLLELTDAPPGVTGEAVNRLQPAAMETWRKHLESSWTNERPGWLKRSWRALWLLRASRVDSQ